MRCPSFVRRAVLALVVVFAGVVAGAPRQALAFHGHHDCHDGGWHGGGFGGWGHHGWGGPHCGFGPWGGGWPACGWGGYGWGAPCWPVFGNLSYGTGFAFGNTRFWSGTTILGVPGWGGCGFGAPAWYGGWNAGPAWGWNPGPAWGWNPGPAWGWNPGPAWGWNPGPVRGWNVGPARGWNPGPAPGWNMPFAAMAPVGAGPFKAPFNPGLPGIGAAPLGLAADRGPRTTVALLPARRPAAVELPGIPAEDALGRGQLGAPSIDGAVEVAIRTSNAPARARAARLVAIGDRHLRDAITDPAKLAKAIDAYRRASGIAPDQPDIFLRQAIACTAAGKGTAAATAVGRAVAIDSRLADAAAGEGVQGGMAVQAGPQAPVLLARSEKLLARIFSAPEGGPDVAAGNWIADRWLGRDAGPVMVAARP